MTNESRKVRDKNLTHQTRIAFVASDVPEAQTALLQLRGQFSHTDPDHADIIVAAAQAAGISAVVIGHSGGDSLKFSDGTTISVADLARENSRFFPEWMVG